jgi:hypothetical protein
MPDPSSSLINLNLTEPISKLIEAVRAAVGASYEPKRIRRKADADAYALRVAARAEGDAALIKAESEIELQLLAEQAQERTKNLEIRRQRNIDVIVDQAIDQLPTSVNNQPVDEDWIVQFFNYAQDIGNNEMQQLWAKLLAGEVAEPGSFSLRTLQTVRVLSPEDAKLFQRFNAYIWNGYVHLYGGASTEIMKRRDLGFIDLVHLQSLGLLSATSDAALTVAEENNPFEATYFDKRHIINAQPWLQIGCYPLTDIGVELGTLCEAEPDEEYRLALVEDWKAHGAEVTVVENDEDAVLPSSDSE